MFRTVNLIQLVEPTWCHLDQSSPVIHCLLLNVIDPMDLKSIQMGLSIALKLKANGIF